jgi:AcrR family transcriptional regulator
VQNVVPAASETVEAALADRAVAERRAAYAIEARRLIDAAFVVMRREGNIDPQVRAIVHEAGLSNQAFYRHFASKDALLLAVLADGQRQLVAYLSRRVASVSDPSEQVQRWISGVMAQARNRDAAEATRPFACNSARLADLFPADMATSLAETLVSLSPAVLALGGSVEDAELVRDLAFARMNDAIAHRRVPSRAETQRLVEFCLAGITGVR